MPLGDVGSPWGIGSVGVQRETQTRPGYAVQPFNAETLNRTAFEPTAPHVFAHYWRSGWPRDLLLLLMVEAIEKTDAEGDTVLHQRSQHHFRRLRAARGLDRLHLRARTARLSRLHR
ncbi:MAG: hypothetical protein R3C16_06405 [Hyphomonadaceae bacterium]